jgi:multiple sugar transport system permease protein/raffinose/stachyose/melibiose transport system permease protein
MTIICFIVPFAYLVIVSFYQWDGLSPKVFVSLQNYTRVFNDPVFQMAVKNTLLWMVVAVCIHLPLGFLLALALHGEPKGWKLYRFIFFVPNVISTTAISFLWYFIYHVDVGLINGVLTFIGLESLAQPWLNDPKTALFANQIPFAIYVGLTMVIFMTHLSTISSDVYEAAEIDGAVGYQKHLYISLPLSLPAIVTNLILNLAFCLRTFEYPFLMTGGGPANATTNLSLYIYREMMQANRYGFSMVAGLLTIAIGAIVMATVVKIQNTYERGSE